MNNVLTHNAPPIRTRIVLVRNFVPLVSCLILIGCQAREMKVELKVNDRAPAFELPDQEGNKISLEQLLAKRKFVAIVFYRSADW